MTTMTMNLGTSMTTGAPNPRTVYISGPMRGIPKWNFPAFDEARNRFNSAGWIALSPADFDRQRGFTEEMTDLPPDFHRKAFRMDCNAICDSDAIALLPGWEKSVGVNMELTLARALGLQVLDAITMTPIMEESVCLTAERIVGGDRRNQYGHPHADYAAATSAFNSFTRRQGPFALSPAEGVMFMMCVKLSREGHKHKTDNLVDLCGYAKCKQLIHALEDSKK